MQIIFITVLCSYEVLSLLYSSRVYRCLACFHYVPFLKKRRYTDTANFALHCGVYQIGVIGQKVNFKSMVFFFFFYSWLLFGSSKLTWRKWPPVFQFFICFRNMHRPKSISTFKNTDSRTLQKLGVEFQFALKTLQNIVFKKFLFFSFSL